MISRVRWTWRRGCVDRPRLNFKQMLIVFYARFNMHLLVCISFVVITMTPPPKCCNPFKKDNHSCFRKNLTYLSENYDKKFSALFGLFVCASCKRQLYLHKDSIELEGLDIKCSKQIDDNKEKSSSDEEQTEENDRDYVCKLVDNKIERQKIVSAFEELITAPPEKKVHLDLTNEEQNILQKSISGTNFNVFNNLSCDGWIMELKEAVSRARSREQKIVLLTTLPSTWSIRNIAKEFNVSRRLVSNVKKLQSDKGHGTYPEKKKGHSLNLNLLESVNEYFLSDEVSRVMPGVKDVKSIVVNGKREHKTKRLLLENIKNLHEDFLKKHPNEYISLASFKALRPKQCIVVGAKGTHNVCVCKIHGNIRLKFRGIKEECTRKKFEFKASYRNYLKEMTCLNPSDDCFLGNCKVCPGAIKIIQDLKTILFNLKIKDISYSQWVTTDRCQLLCQTEKIDIFLTNFQYDLSNVLKHDYIAQVQAEFLEELKKNLEDSEFIVTLDFSENYSFHVQDAIQSQHWCKDQATLHVYVIYYKKDNTLQNINYVVFSEYENHDAAGVNLYNSKMIQFLKRKFGVRNVKKIYYYSDGAGSQYKNKFNLLNLVHHEKDFGIKAEWHFFATAHGKGACDGIGGCVKRHAYRASLQNKSIVTTQKLYEWARDFFKKINFDFCSLDEYKKNEKKLTARFSSAKTIAGTRKFHCYKPFNMKQLECKITSNSETFVLLKVSK